MIANKDGINKGEKVALIGRVGTGKSTVASLLMRFYEPSHGTLMYAGADVNDMDAKELRSQIGYVSQDPLLFNCTVYDNISLGRLDAPREDVESAAKKAGIHDFICSLPLGYQTVVGDRGCSLSGGQKQGISLARAILKDAPVLILDEATSALDTRSEEEVLDTLDSLMVDRTVIMITHHLTRPSTFDRIITLGEGSIQE